MKYDYGFEERGLSYEHHNFYGTLAGMGYEVEHFDFMDLFLKHGRRRMNEMLLARVEKFKPDLLFCALFTDEFEPAVLRRISESTPTVTFNWFADDDWRFDTFSKHWAPLFNWCSTTSRSALEKYRKLGYSRIIQSQWGFNPEIYRKLKLPKKYGVTFVGQAHGNRRQVVGQLRSLGLAVECFGKGWEHGRVSQEDMVRIFNQSRINLNLSQVSSASVAQIKGRDFEIPGCGGFLLTGKAAGIEDYFKPGKEIARYGSSADLVEKAQYYLAHEKEREAIALAGYRRAMKEHTYQRRFSAIFSRMFRAY
jgi:spore maturation protein CgeB